MNRSLALQAAEKKCVSSTNDDDQTHTNNSIGMLEERFHYCCNINSDENCLKELDSMRDDDEQCEGWKEMINMSKKASLMGFHERLERAIDFYGRCYSDGHGRGHGHFSPSLEELRRMLQLICDEKRNVPIHAVYSFTRCHFEQHELFREIIQMSSEQFSIFDEFISSKCLFTECSIDVGIEFRNCFRFISNIQEYPINTREEIFKYRLKWLIPLVKSQQLIRDYKLNLQNIKLNVDIYIYLHDTSEWKTQIFIIFSELSDIDQAFQSEELYKLLIILLVSRACNSNYSVNIGFLVCKSFIICLQITSSANIYIGKFYLNSIDDMLLMYLNVEQYLSSSKPSALYSLVYKKLKEKEENKRKQQLEKERLENRRAIQNIPQVKGIEKQTKQSTNSSISINTRKALQNISNLMK